MVTVPPRHYCVIENPVLRNDKGDIVSDKSGQAKLQHADQEIRLAQEPFPLYPGEVLKQAVTPLKIVPANSALRLRAILDFEDEVEKRIAGDEWLFEGPGELSFPPASAVEGIKSVWCVCLCICVSVCQLVSALTAQLFEFSDRRHAVTSRDITA